MGQMEVTVAPGGDFAVLLGLSSPSRGTGSPLLLLEASECSGVTLVTSGVYFDHRPALRFWTGNQV